MSTCVRLTIAALIGCGLLGGCVERTIDVTSNPSGARVYLNDREVGRTPVDVPFTFYGIYDVRLERAGYKPLLTKRNAQAPWWEYPGPDLLADAVPGAKSTLHWRFDMDKQTPPGEVSTEALKRRARRLRLRSRQ